MANQEGASWLQKIGGRIKRPIIGNFNDDQKERLAAVRHGLQWLERNPDIDLKSEEGMKALTEALLANNPQLHHVDDVAKDVFFAQGNGWQSMLSHVNTWASGRSKMGR